MNPGERRTASGTLETSTASVRRSRVSRFRWAVGVAALVLCLVPTGCSAPDHEGITAGPDGLPEVINCGTWISGVAVSDGDSGRSVWAAEAVPAEGGGINDVGRVRLGDLPASDWVETSVYDPEPPPSTWKFRIEGPGDPVAILVPANELDENTVFRPDGAESLAHFEDRTCAALPISSTTAATLFWLLVALSVAVAYAIVRRNQRVRSSDGTG